MAGRETMTASHPMPSSVQGSVGTGKEVAAGELEVEQWCDGAGLLVLEGVQMAEFSAAAAAAAVVVDGAGAGGLSVSSVACAEVSMEEGGRRKRQIDLTRCPGD